MLVGFTENLAEDPPKVRSVLLTGLLAQMETSEKLKKKTAAIRAATNKDERRKLKKKLPAISVSADTTCRNASPDDKRTGLIFIDLDGSDNPDTDLEKVVDSMACHYPWLIGYFTSPSGDGLKVLCGIQPDAETHLRSFKALDAVFSEHGLNVDQSCKDLKRLTYLCHDPDVERTLIEPLKQWQGERINPAPAEKKKSYKVKKDFTSDLSPDDEAALCLEHLDPDMDYHDWMTVGMALKDHGACLSVWDDWSSGGVTYKPGECELKWESFKGKGVSFGTVVHMAKEANGGNNPIEQCRSEKKRLTISSSDYDDLEDAPPEAYHYKDRYWILDHTGTRYIGLVSTDMRRRLRSMGFSTEREDDALSAVEQIMDDTVFKNSIDFASPIAGRSIGLFVDVNGKRFLISSKNKRVEPVAGDWELIKQITEGMLKDQVVYFYSWLHIARKQLNTESYTQGHVLATAGKTNCGKSLMASTIIKPLLGSVADPTKYLSGKTDFNADLVGAELLLMDDKGGKRTAEARLTLAHNLKEIAAGSHTVSCHPKGKDAFTVHPLWRLVVCMNDDDQAMTAFPAIGEGDSDSIGDKVLLLKCFNDIPLPYAGDKDQPTKLGAVIGSELAAFAHFVDNYEIPAEIMTGNCRFGFDDYHHPDLLEIINQNSNERTLLSATDEILFADKGANSEIELEFDDTTQRYSWTGTAEEWSKIIRSATWHGAHRTINNELGYGTTAKKAGRSLARVAKVSDGRVIKFDSRTGRGWRIWEPRDPSETGELF